MTDTLPAPRPIFLDEAEAEKMRAEAQAAVEAAAKNAAEARKLNAEALAAEHAAAKNLIELEREQYKRARELTKDEHHHRYVFTGAVDLSSATKCSDQLDHWDRTEKPGKIELVLFSPGGSVFAGMGLFDQIVALRAKKWDVTTICRGYAASMAGILVQAGSTRVMGPESFIHIHEVSGGAIGKTSEIEDEVKLMEKMNSRIVDIYAARSKLTKTRIRSSMKRKEWWIDSTEALRLGIVDKIA